MRQEEYLQVQEEEAIIQPPEKKHTDPLISFVLSQTVVCCLALLAVGVMRLAGGTVYNTVRAAYINRFCDTTSVSEVVDAISGKAGAEQTRQSLSSSASAPQSAIAAMAPVTETEPQLLPQETYGDTADDSLALKEEPLLMNTAVKKWESTNDMAVPVQGTVTSPFGYRIHPIYGTRLFHNGVDIGADSGTPIAAALSGTVETATYNDSYGYYIIIDHGNDFRTVYAHCSELTAEQGQQVEKGETIALVGSTGVSTGPHLHFEVRRGEYRINPEWLVDLS